jgi:hypothetical protein
VLSLTPQDICRSSKLDTKAKAQLETLPARPKHIEDCAWLGNSL